MEKKLSKKLILYVLFFAILGGFYTARALSPACKKTDERLRLFSVGKGASFGRVKQHVLEKISADVDKSMCKYLRSFNISRNLFKDRDLLLHAKGDCRTIFKCNKKSALADKRYLAAPTKLSEGVREVFKGYQVSLFIIDDQNLLDSENIVVSAACTNKKVMLECGREVGKESLLLMASLYHERAHIEYEDMLGCMIVRGVQNFSSSMLSYDKCWSKFMPVRRAQELRADAYAAVNMPNGAQILIDEFRKKRISDKRMAGLPSDKRSHPYYSVRIAWLEKVKSYIDKTLI